jgi:uncharacterized BrkB/YihY/UPF0761 family membrane protein
MKKTWMPMTAGILNIISGLLTLLGALGVLIAIAYVSSASSTQVFSNMMHDLDASGVGLNFVISILVIAAVFLVVIGVMPLIGGIYALQRKKWGLALAGSIAAVLGSSVLGIAATVFIALSKDEFV